MNKLRADKNELQNKEEDHNISSKALHFLIEVEEEDATLLPVFPHILHKYFCMRKELGNDEVVGLGNSSRGTL